MFAIIKIDLYQLCMTISSQVCRLIPLVLYIAIQLVTVHLLYTNVVVGLASQYNVMLTTGFCV